MGAIPEQLVQQVVTETSERMSKDPNYAQLAVGNFVQAHPNVSRYVTAHSDAIGGEGVIHVVFHAEVLAECFRRHLGRDIPPVGFAELDAASSDATTDRFREAEPALADYVRSNIDEEPMREVLALIGLAFHDAAS